jgi:hypothetical protein
MRIVQDWFWAIEREASRVNDRDSEWWPFHFLKPEPEQRISLWRTATLAVLYGLPAMLLAVTLATLSGNRVSLEELAQLTTSLILALFSVLSAVVSLVWNRRAARLERLRRHRQR